MSDDTDYDINWKEFGKMGSEFKSGPLKGENKWTIVGYAVAGIILIGLIGTWIS
jgi:hypothetical protein